MNRIGCDVSHHQGVIDWLTLSRRNLSFSYQRATYGAMKDTRFVSNWANSKGLIERGFYAYFLAGLTVESQISAITQQVGDDYGELSPMLDLEWYSGDGESNRPGSNYLIQVTSMLSAIDNLTGMLTGVYTRTNHITTYLRMPAEDTVAYRLYWALGSRPLWLAQYTGTSDTSFGAPTTIPMPWIDNWMMQKSGDANRAAHYYGIKGSHALDLNVMKECDGLDDLPDPPPIPPDPPPSPVIRWKVIASKLNVRQSPDANSPDVGDLYAGQIVTERSQFENANELWVQHDAGWSAARWFGNLYMVKL